MKKSKFVTGLSAAFISAMALMSCSTSIRAKNGVILTIDGKEYTAEELFEDQKTPAAAEAKFNAVYKVAIRAYFRKNTADKDEIEKNTKIKISEQKATAQSNAATNGTSYAVEWKKILDSNGVEDEQGLYNKFEYELQKEKFENRFYDEHYKNLRNGEHFSDELVDVEFNNYLKAKQPYHIKHILIKLASAKAGDGVSAEISADEAHKISTVIRLLAEGNLSFEQISDLYNEDESAKANHGSLGIMSRDTSFVNDFKLGIYLYESFFSNSTKGEESEPHTIYESINAKKELGLDIGVAGDYATKISEMKDPSGVTKSGAKLGLGLIPYEEALNLEKYKNDDFSKQSIVDKFNDANLGKDDVAAKYYPRNVIFNKYFNKHNIMLITPNNAPALGDIGTYVDTTTGKKRIKEDSYNGTFTSTYANMPGFNYFKQGTSGVNKFAKNDDVLLDDIQIPNDEGSAAPANTDKKVLRDNNGRTILVFHSGTGDSSSNDAYQGIHFVVIERSPFVTYEFDKTTATGEDDQAYKTSRDEYYTEYWPGQSGGSHPTYDTGDAKKTYVNYIKDQDSKVLKERADTVKSELKKCAPNLNTYLYQHLIKVGDINFDSNTVAQGIKTSIDDWITISRISQKTKDARTWDDTWQTYYYSLSAQEEQRKEVDTDPAAETKEIHSRLVPEICARAFNGEVTVTADILAKLFGKGGVFHE